MVPKLRAITLTSSDIMSSNPIYTQEELDEKIKHRTDETSFKERVLLSLNQIEKTLVEIKSDQKDLQLKKMDKLEFTNSWEPRLVKVESKMESIERAYDKFTGSIKILTYLFGGAGVLWPIIIVFLSHYWK